MKPGFWSFTSLEQGMKEVLKCHKNAWKFDIFSNINKNKQMNKNKNIIPYRDRPTPFWCTFCGRKIRPNYFIIQKNKIMLEGLWVL